MLNPYKLSFLRNLIGQPNPQEELRQLEEKCKEVYGAYEEAVNVTKTMEEDMVKIKEDTKALKEELSKKSGDLAIYEQKQAEALARKAKAEEALITLQGVMAREEAERRDLENEKKAMEGGVGGKKKEVEEARMQLQKVENDKNSRDHTMKGLNEEIAEQDEVINRLNKEKKMAAEQSAKSSEDLQGAEEKVNHLLNIKKKLESTLDELEGSYEKEKRGRTQVEKERRKIEGELRMMQDGVADYERSKKEMEALIGRKEKDIMGLASKLEDEQGIVVKIQRTIKEYQQRIEELEEELEAERQSRANAERQRGDLARELEDLGDRLDEAGGATQAQIELNKKREAELLKLRKDLEEANIQHESIVHGLKKKHQDAVQEINEQIDQLQKMKSRIKKDKAHIQNEITDARAARDEIQRSKASVEKSNKALQNNLNELMKKVEEAKYAISDVDNAKRKTAVENADFLRCVGELDNSFNILLKIKNDLSTQLSEAKSVADNEARERQLLVGKHKNFEHEFEGARGVLDEETSALDNLCRTVTKAEGEASQWRQKYEMDAVARAEELEMGRMKLQARLSESEMAITNLQLKLSQIEKTKAKTQSELEDMVANLDQAQIMQHTMEKRAKQFDKVCGEWKGKVDGLSRDLDNSQKDTRIASAELFKVKAAYDESVLQLDEVRRENKTLSGEIKDIMDQISEGGRSIHEIDKIRKRLEAEKIELQSALEEAESTLEQEENKVLRCQLELSQMKMEIEKRIQQKEAEFMMIRKNQTKAIEGMQATLDTETKSKAEALRMKKKLETDVLDLETGLDHANASNQETQKSIQKYGQQVREVQDKLEQESHAKSAAHEGLVSAERKCNANKNALEEARTLLEQCDRNRR